MALSLVADYDSSSSDSEYESADPIKESAIQLAPALEMLGEHSSISSSVFHNPYREAENYEASILEKHVKMTMTKTTENNTTAKKVCFKFMKGKCRLGDSCRFLHQNPMKNTDDSHNSDSEEQATNQKKVKKRCGLKDDLVPPKKFMKMYKNK